MRYDGTRKESWRQVQTPHVLCCVVNCEEDAVWCQTWQTWTMPAPAFYYFCQSHAEQVTGNLRGATKDA